MGAGRPAPVLGTRGLVGPSAAVLLAAGCSDPDPPTATAGTTGVWRTLWLDEGTGVDRGTTAGRYLWGFAAIVPDQPGTAMLVEPIDGHPRFDRQGLAPAPVIVEVASSAGGWHGEPIAAFPVAGPPQVRVTTPARHVGVVSQPHVELDTRPNCDNPGLVDVALQAGGWVGWDPQAGALVVKP